MFVPVLLGSLCSNALARAEAPPSCWTQKEFLITFWCSPPATDEALARVVKLDAIAKARGQSLAQMALCWILRRKTVTSALIGASSPAQIEENVQALKAAPLTAAELKAIDDACQ